MLGLSCNPQFLRNLHRENFQCELVIPTHFEILQNTEPEQDHKVTIGFAIKFPNLSHPESQPIGKGHPSDFDPSRHEDLKRMIDPHDAKETGQLNGPRLRVKWHLRLD